MRHFQVKQTNSEFFAFDAAADVVAYVDPRLFESRREGFVGRKLDEWTEVQAAAQAKWQHGMEVLEAYIQRLQDIPMPEVKDHRRRVHFDEHDGDEVDFDRLRAGQPFWRESRREEVLGPYTVTVVIDTTTPSREDSDNILWRGAAAIALTHILEARGFAVELWVVNGSDLFADQPSKHVLTACCLKRHSDPLDVSTLINSVSGWFYRTATFTLLDTICKGEGHDVAWGYGSCATPKNADLDALSLDPLRVYSRGVFSFDGALSMIKAELEAVNARHRGDN